MIYPVLLNCVHMLRTNVRGGGGGLRGFATLLFSIALKIVVGWLVGWY